MSRYSFFHLQRTYFILSAVRILYWEYFQFSKINDLLLYPLLKIYKTYSFLENLLLFLVLGILFLMFTWNSCKVKKEEGFCCNSFNFPFSVWTSSIRVLLMDCFLNVGLKFSWRYWAIILLFISLNKIYPFLKRGLFSNILRDYSCIFLQVVTTSSPFMFKFGVTLWWSIGDFFRFFYNNFQTYVIHNHSCFSFTERVHGDYHFLLPC